MNNDKKVAIISAVVLIVGFPLCWALGAIGLAFTIAFFAAIIFVVFVTKIVLNEAKKEYARRQKTRKDISDIADYIRKHK